MVRFLDSLFGNIAPFGAAQRAWNRHKHPGIGIAAGVKLKIDGTFRYGTGCTIGEGANIIVPEGSELILANDCYLGRYVEISPGGRIEIGTSTSIQDRCIVLGDVTVGSHCLFAPNIMLSSGHHNFDLDPASLIRDQDRRVSQDPKLAALRSRPIVIEDDCWLGINGVVMRGVTIGKGAIVGAGSIVVKDVRPYTVVAGVPSKEIKKRLGFKPPKRIDFANADDLPYFYSGFEISQASRLKYTAYGGIAARSDFVVCLDTSAEGALHIVVKSLDSAGCELAVGSSRGRVTGIFQEIVFDDGFERSAEARVAIRALPGTAILVVKEAWIA